MAIEIAIITGVILARAVMGVLHFTVGKRSADGI